MIIIIIYKVQIIAYISYSRLYHFGFSSNYDLILQF
jgi:hypothetical protein